MAQNGSGGDVKDYIREKIRSGKFLIKKDHKGREFESWTLLGGDERLGRDVDGEHDDDDA